MANEQELAEFIFAKLIEKEVLVDLDSEDQKLAVDVIKDAIVEFNMRDKETIEPEAFE